ncbi:MAG: ComEC family competence protein [Bacteroidia bacterium]|jgi:competence protein ComEC|nr:ComEC family competence protein [Bacteroidia bacterium]
MSPLRWSQFPLIRPLIAFLAGMCVALCGAGWWGGLGLGVVALGGFLYSRRKGHERLPVWSDVWWIAALFAGCGWMCMGLSEAALPRQVPEAGAVLVRITETPVARLKTVKLTAEVLAVRATQGWEAFRGGAVVQLKRSSSAEMLRYGDELLIIASPEKVPPPRNPGEFDYAAWLQHKGIGMKLTADEEHWQLTQSGNGNAVKAAALELRDWFAQSLKNAGLSGDRLSVAQALLLGNDDEIDPGLLKAYSASGTLHVLSVSGMHVALLFTALSWLLAPMLRLRGGKYWLALLMLAALWGYAMLTGASPSVLRAVTMLSFVVAGQPFQRHGHILNMLAAAALVLLIVNPQLVTDVGFQLSFVAVGGIVVLQPVFQQVWRPRGKVMRGIWSLVSVTLVAQLVTFPLGLYYFGQFPLYFLLSNMAVIPLSTLIMYGGLLLLVAAPLGQIGKWVAVPVCWLLDVLNGAVRYTEFLPSAVLYSSQWSLLQLSLLYSLLAAGVCWLWMQRPRLLTAAVTAAVLLLTTIIANDIQQMQTRKLIVYSLPGATAIGTQQGTQHILFSDSTLISRPGLNDFHIIPGLRQQGLKPKSPLVLSDSLRFNHSLAAARGQWINTQGKVIFRATRKCRWKNIHAHCDLLLLTQNTGCRLDSLLKRTTPLMVVADGSNSDKKISRWKNICIKNKIGFWDAKHDGALVWEWKD